MKYFVYIVRCNDKSLYTGITTNPERRVRQHNGELVGGATYTRSRRPVQLKYAEACLDRSRALVREAEIKKLPRKEKEILIAK